MIAATMADTSTTGYLDMADIPPVPSDVALLTPRSMDNDTFSMVEEKIL